MLPITQDELLLMEEDRPFQGSRNPCRVSPSRTRSTPAPKGPATKGDLNICESESYIFA